MMTAKNEVIVAVSSQQELKMIIISINTYFIRQATDCVSWLSLSIAHSSILVCNNSFLCISVLSYAPRCKVQGLGIRVAMVLPSSLHCLGSVLLK